MEQNRNFEKLIMFTFFPYYLNRLESKMLFSLFTFTYCSFHFKNGTEQRSFCSKNSLSLYLSYHLYAKFHVTKLGIHYRIDDSKLCNTKAS